MEHNCYPVLLVARKGAGEQYANTLIASKSNLRGLLVAEEE